MEGSSVSRQFAGIILFIGMVASGLAAAMALAGNVSLSLMICGGAVVLAVLVLVIGGVVVASNEPGEE